jgi:hypothetical protein
MSLIPLLLVFLVVVAVSVSSYPCRFLNAAPGLGVLYTGITIASDNNNITFVCAEVNFGDFCSVGIDLPESTSLTIVAIAKVINAIAEFFFKKKSTTIINIFFPVVSISETILLIIFSIFFQREKLLHKQPSQRDFLLSLV